MSDKVLMKGNEALAEAAIQAGCRLFFGYRLRRRRSLRPIWQRKMPKGGWPVFTGRERSCGD